MTRILLSQHILIKLIQPHRSENVDICNWFVKGQNDPANPIRPYITWTTMAIVEASAKAHMAFNEQEVLKQLKSNMMHNIYNIDRGVAERFALMLAELNKSITGERFQTLDIIDAATAVENGLSFCTFHDKPMDHLQKTFGLNLSLPSRTMAISA